MATPMACTKLHYYPGVSTAFRYNLVGGHNHITLIEVQLFDTTFYSSKTGRSAAAEQDLKIIS